MSISMGAGGVSVRAEVRSDALVRISALRSWRPSDARRSICCAWSNLVVTLEPTCCIGGVANCAAGTFEVNDKDRGAGNGARGTGAGAIDKDRRIGGGIMKTRTGIADAGEPDAVRAGRDTVPLLMERELAMAFSDIRGSGDGEGPPGGREIKVGDTRTRSIVCNGVAPAIPSCK